MGKVRERFVIILDVNKVLSTEEMALIGQSSQLVEERAA
jgi:hypothetical protein